MFMTMSYSLSRVMMLAELTVPSSIGMLILLGIPGLLQLNALLLLPFVMLVGQFPLGGLVGGRGRARFWNVSLGGKSMRRHRPSLVNPLDATEVHLFRSQSVAPLLAVKRDCVVWLVY